MNELQEIRNKLSELNLLDEVFIFKCFDSDIFTFVNDSDVKYYNDYEISFIAKDNTLVWNLTGLELLNLKNKQYFELRIFNHNLDVTYEKTFNIYNQAN